MRARLAATIVPVRYARMLAGLLFVVAMALPWIAARQGVVRFDGRTTTPNPAQPIRMRPELVELPDGTFVMGSSKTEAEREDDETQHSVRVAPFAMFRTEVTLAQWEAIMGSRPNDCQYGCEDGHPVHKVSMYDAMKYANRLTEAENKLASATPLTRCYDETKWSWDRACTGYRLPTEAEWEYAARAGTTTAYSFGDDPKELCAYGNFADQSAKRARPAWKFTDDVCDDRFPNLAPAGSFKANKWGLFDMHGNVWEWNWDNFVSYTDKPVTSDTGKLSDIVTDSDKRVLRGGSFSLGSGRLRSANRDGYHPTVSDVVFGFRCVRGVTATQ